MVWSAACSFCISRASDPFHSASQTTPWGPSNAVNSVIYNIIPIGAAYSLVYGHIRLIKASVQRSLGAKKHSHFNATTGARSQAQGRRG